MQTTRRSALKTGLLVGAAVVLPFRVQAAAPRIRVGFLGTSHSHFREKHRVLRSSDDFELVGLCEEDPVARAKAPDDSRWISRKRLVEEADVVVVEGRVSELARDAAFALRAGKHVHVEKPPAARLSEFRRLVSLAQKRGCQLQVGYMWRHNPGFIRAIEAARKGWLGEVFLVRATMNTQISDEARRDWAAFPGGAMFEQGSHLVDAAVRLLGRPLKVTPFLQRRRPDGLADNTVAVFQYPASMAILTSAPLQPNAGTHRFLEIMGTEGTARVQPIEPPALELDLAAAAGIYAKGRHMVPLHPYQRYVGEFQELAAAVRGQSRLSVSLGEELLIHETLMKACGH